MEVVVVVFVVVVVVVVVAVGWKEVASCKLVFVVAAFFNVIVKSFWWDIANTSILNRT